jgi:hypothetical protein
VIRNGPVLAVRLQSASEPKADWHEDDFDAIWAQFGRVNGQAIVPAGGKAAGWTGTEQAASRTGGPFSIGRVVDRAASDESCTAMS